jgi:AraC-like DNA-binding protein
MREMLMLRASFTQHRYELHTHDTYVIGVVTRGVERLRVGARRYLAPQGAIILVNPEEPHDGEPGREGGWAYRTLYPQASLFAKVMEELDGHGLPGFGRAVIDDPGLSQRLLAAHGLAEADDAVEAEAALLLSLRLLIHRHGGTGAPELKPHGAAMKRLDCYRDFIEANLASSIDLGALAGLAQVTRFQVIRDFKGATGLTPGSYIRQRRQLAAARFIEQGMPLAEAAQAAGFADQSHLNRVFRKITGVTPRMFRTACAAPAQA